MFLVRIIMLHADFKDPIEMEFYSGFGTDTAILNMLLERNNGLILHMDIERVKDA